MYGIEYEGYGRLGGFNVYIDDFDFFINDVYLYFFKIVGLFLNFFFFIC